MSLRDQNRGGKAAAELKKFLQARTIIPISI
jgi:hypothetical protein